MMRYLIAYVALVVFGFYLGFSFPRYSLQDHEKQIYTVVIPAEERPINFVCNPIPGRICVVTATPDGRVMVRTANIPAELVRSDYQAPIAEPLPDEAVIE